MKPSALIILKALRRGEVLTPCVSLSRYKIHALSQRVGELRRDSSVDDMIISERVTGDVFHKYYISGAAKNAVKKTGKPVVVAAHTRKARKSFDNQPTFEW